MSARQEPFMAADPSLHANDALVQAIVWLSKHHGRERSAQSLLAGTPLDGNLGPDQAVRVMRDAGFNAGLIQRRIGDIHALLLPAVLLLKNGDAAIVVARRPAKKGADTYDVVMPGPESHACKATEEELSSEYTGFAFVASPKPQAPANPAQELILDPNAHWLWGTLRRFMPYYRSALLAAALSNVLMLASGLVTSVVFDKVIPHQAFVTLWALATGGFIAMVFDLISRQLRSHLIDSAGKKADLIIGSLLFRQTLGVRMEHRPESAGSYAHHLGQIETVRDFFAGATLSALSDLPFIVIFVAMTFVIGGPLGWVLLAAIPLILGMAWLIQSSLRRSMSANMGHQADLQGLLVEAVEGLEDLKAMGAQGRFLRRYEEATAAAAETALRARNLGGLTNNISAMSQQLITLVMLVVGVYLIHDGVISGGALIGAIMFSGRAVGPLGSVVGLATRYQGARAAMVSLDRMMNLPVERAPGASYVANHEVKGRLALREVGFAYPPATPDATAPKVLKGLTLKFEPGERVVILGRIGSGKSTVLRLLAGLYQPTEGMVEVDGIDLRQIDPADFRAKVGFVSQEPRLFKGTLRENVLMGRASVDAERLTEVARVTGLDRLVASHPQGWELPVGEMGSLLSGGQRQLVALARCLVTQPQILLMDEPTSSMDAQSETMFLRQLNEALGTRTVIMVTHRPAVLDLAQRVLVVDGGKVVLDGPKAQVLAALSGARPAATATPESNASPNVHLHPSTQPVQRQASV
ncbi:MAG: type I secretion system permease/ATPase [Rhizobacter sp.]|nr:type I secretion system permease/ATPase [Rhizobacter sp.]